MKIETIADALGLVAALLGLAACAGCASSKSCTLAGCDSTVSASYDVPVARADLEGATLTVCKNGACSSAVVVRAPRAIPDPQFLCPYDASTPIMCNVDVLSTTSAKIAIQYRVAPDDAHDGDAYTVTLKRATGEVVLTKSASASYTTTQPNGPSCEPTCKQASL
jgi:hypothetical protein